MIQASEVEMKGRVIKKAKRRNMTEDGKKNVFAGLTFTSQGSVNTAFNIFYLHVFCLFF